MNSRKTNFYDEYDELFIKPRPLKRIKLKQPKTKIAVKKAQKSPAVQTKTPKKWRKSIWSILFFLIVAFFAIRFLNSYRFEKMYGKEVYSYPLKEAKIQPTGEIDLSEPLSITLSDHTFDLNKGYQLTIKGDSDIKLLGDELSVLPTKGDFPQEQYVAEARFYSGRELDRDSEINISGNLQNSMCCYFENAKNDFAIVFPQPDIVDVKTGYVLSYDDQGADEEEGANTLLFKYYLFKDGTGMSIKLRSSDIERKDWDRSVQYTTARKMYQADFDFLDKNFIFTEKQAQ